LNASVIIPSYYRTHDLSQLFECLLNQRTKPNEVLVVDDTPTADSSIKNLCEEFSARFNQGDIILQYIRKQRERSVAISRNLGAKMAHGDTLIFIDSDIRPSPDYIEKVLQIFNKYPSALGVGGWFPPSHKTMKGFRYYFNQILRRLFSLTHDSRNSCRNFEYPIELSNTIHCQYLLGGSMSFRKRVFDEFQFDESLKAHAFGEDFLFSNSVSKKYPNALLLSPEARICNAPSQEARLKGEELLDTQFRNAKYILTKLWGLKGLLLFGRQYVGIVFLNNEEKLWEIRKV